jgi:hypothetical protein
MTLDIYSIFTEDKELLTLDGKANIFTSRRSAQNFVKDNCIDSAIVRSRRIKI